MEANELLQMLTARGLDVQAEAGQLLVRPSCLLDQRLRQLVRHHRDELIEIVTTSRDLGWVRMRAIAAHLGAQVEADGRWHQLWGVTPRGAILFDGNVLRSVPLDEVKPP